MVGTILGFGGRIGRLRYLMWSLALAAALTALVFTFVFGLAPDVMTRAAVAGLAIKVVLIVLPIFLWATTALAAKRFRDIGWRPLYVIPGWALAILCDTLVALAMPALAIGESDQTPVGLSLSLLMVGALLFWPGREPDYEAPDIAAMSRPHLEPARAERSTAMPRRLTAAPAAPGGFGRRRS